MLCAITNIRATWTNIVRRGEGGLMIERAGGPIWSGKSLAPCGRDAEGADRALQARMATVIRHVLAAVAETQAHRGGAGWPVRILRHGRAHRGMALPHPRVRAGHAGDRDDARRRRPPDRRQRRGPAVPARTPRTACSPALMMRPDESGGKAVPIGPGGGRQPPARPIPHAMMDVWQANAAGAYGGGRPGPARLELPPPRAGRCRRPGTRSRLSIPGCYEIGDLSGMACGDLMRRLGRHGMRPGHVHVKLSAHRDRSR